MTIQSVGTDYVREYEEINIESLQEQLMHRARTQSYKATKPLPWWVAVLSSAAVFGATFWTLAQVFFWRVNW